MAVVRCLRSPRALAFGASAAPRDRAPPSPPADCSSRIRREAVDGRDARIEPGPQRPARSSERSHWRTISSTTSRAIRSASRSAAVTLGGSAPSKSSQTVRQLAVPSRRCPGCRAPRGRRCGRGWTSSALRARPTSRRRSAGTPKISVAGRSPRSTVTADGSPRRGQRVEPAGLGNARDALQERPHAVGTRARRQADAVAADQPAGVGHLAQPADVAHPDVVRGDKLGGRRQYPVERLELLDHPSDLRHHVGDLRDLVGDDDRVAGAEQARLPTAARPRPDRHGHHQCCKSASAISSSSSAHPGAARAAKRGNPRSPTRAAGGRRGW